MTTRLAEVVTCAATTREGKPCPVRKGLDADGLCHRHNGGSARAGAAALASTNEYRQEIAEVKRRYKDLKIHKDNLAHHNFLYKVRALQQEIREQVTRNSPNKYQVLLGAHQLELTLLDRLHPAPKDDPDQFPADHDWVEEIQLADPALQAAVDC